MTTSTAPPFLPLRTTPTTTATIAAPLLPLRSIPTTMSTTSPSSSPSPWLQQPHHHRCSSSPGPQHPHHHRPLLFFRCIDGVRRKSRDKLGFVELDDNCLHKVTMAIVREIASVTQLDIERRGTLSTEICCFYILILADGERAVSADGERALTKVQTRRRMLHQPNSRFVQTRALE